MKKFIVLILVIVFALSACDALAVSTQAPAQPTPIPPTPEVIVVTVEVPVEVTAEEAAQASPTSAPTETAPPATATTAATATGAAEAAPTSTVPAGANAPTGGPVAVNASLWGSAFKDIAYSNPSFSLRCQPTQITFDATVNDPAITAVDFYYRIEDRNGTTISEWKNYGRMQVTGDGTTFSLTLSGDAIHPDLRKALAWFDFQLVGLNKQGGVVGRTEKIVQLVTYTIDCQ